MSAPAPIPPRPSGGSPSNDRPDPRRGPATDPGTTPPAGTPPAAEPPARTANPARKLLSRPPVLVARIDDRMVEIYRQERGHGDTWAEIFAGGAPLTPLSDWQYHILMGMFGHGGDTMDGLIGLVRDRFGQDIHPSQIRKLFLDLNDLGLLDKDEATRHALVREFLRSDQPGANPVETARRQQVGTTVQTQAEKQAGVKLFKPLWLLRLLRPLHGLAMPIAVLTVPISVMALFALLGNLTAWTDSFQLLQDRPRFFAMLIGAGLAINIITTLVEAMTLHELGASVDAFVLRRVLFVIPRLSLRVSDTEKLWRRQAILVHAVPLVARILLTACAFLLWDQTRYLGGTVTQLMLAASAAGAITVVLALCPFLDGELYRILVEFLDQPNLRGRAFKALKNRFNPRAYQNTDPGIVTAYALVCLLFSALVLAAVILVAGGRFMRLFGPSGYLVLGALVVGLGWQTVSKLRTTNEAYWKNFRFERWRERTLPTEAQREMENRSRFGMWRVIQLLVISAVIYGLLQPYHYRPSGQILLMPITSSELSTDVEGIIASVAIEGGEQVERGQLVATLDTSDLESELEVYRTRLERATEAERFSSAECDRQQELSDRGVVAQSELSNALRRCMADKTDVETMRAEVALLESRIARSRLTMPFDGTVDTLYLQEMVGSFLRAGDPIARIVDTSSFKANLAIREVDLPLIKRGAPVEIRVFAYPDQPFYGAVTAINAAVDEDVQGHTLNVLVSVENRDGLLRPGMTGFAKTEGIILPIWQIITQSIWRFITIDLWAWLP